MADEAYLVTIKPVQARGDARARDEGTPIEDVELRVPCLSQIAMERSCGEHVLMRRVLRGTAGQEGQRKHTV